MALLLALAVITAVIIFGALISLGNERQRRAIDELREQVVLWAIQDLRIKREHLAVDVRVEDPIGWLNRIAAKVCGSDLKLEVLEVFEEPYVLVCAAGNGSVRVLFTPLSPEEIHGFQKRKRSRLSQLEKRNPLLLMPRRFATHEISTLNGGLLFDLELPLAWSGLTKHKVAPMERIWLYKIGKV